MSDTSTIFSGASRYASDFESLIQRAVAIASLPLAQLQATKTELESESTALGSLGDAFSSLQTAIESLESATGISSYTTAVSDGAIVSAAVSDGAREAVYTIEVTGLGAWTSTLSKDGLTTVTNPATQNISASASFTLTIDGSSSTITPAASTLNGLVDAINDAGLDVSASVVNVGSTASPDYRLSIRSTKLDAVTIQLSDGSNLLDTLATGVQATYKVNGMATAIQSDSRTVTLAPGLTLTLLSQSDAGVATTVTVSRVTSGISNALSSLITAYNAAVDELDTHRGENEGALAGDSLVFSLADSLRQLATYSAGSGTIASLTDLGLSFDDEGKLSLDSTVFTSAGMDALLTFLGSSTESGFLNYATDLLDSVLDSTEGLIPLAAEAVDEQIADGADAIEAEQDRVDAVQANLVERMAAADALIATLEQQVTYITSLFESMRIASRMYS